MLVFIIIIFVAVNIIAKANKAVKQATGENLWQFLNEEANSHQHVQMHQQFQNEMFQQQMQQDAEMARMAATGVEFGGFNSDPNLNPGMSSAMDMGMSTPMDMGMF